METLIISVLLIIGLLVCLVSFLFVSPLFGAKLIKKVFTKPLTITDLEWYQQSSAQIVTQKDQAYPSINERNYFDVYAPEHMTEKVPLLIWVHGGAYVGGDKRDVTEFATNISAAANLVVVTMNYALAPKNKYPSQLEQLEELLQFLIAQPPAFWDQEQILLGGDSAGAQIALQYALVQTSTSYAKNLKKRSLLSKAKARVVGVLSYCGPVDLPLLRSSQKSLVMRFFIRTVAWSLLGTRHWQNSKELLDASIVTHATTDFPATFITDGNKYSFTEQGKRLAEQLSALNVPVTRLFFEKSAGVVPHEYQFDYSKKEAQDCFNKTVNFIETVTNKK